MRTTDTPRTSKQMTKIPPIEGLGETEQIEALQKWREDRRLRWYAESCEFELLFVELRRDIRRLEQEVDDLNSIFAAEKAAEKELEDGNKNWTRWIWSFFLPAATEDSVEEQLRKFDKKDDKRKEKYLTERLLLSTKAELEKRQKLFKQAKDDFAAANTTLEQTLGPIQDKRQAREDRERQERNTVEYERQAKIQKKEQQDRESARVALEAATKKKEDVHRKSKEGELERVLAVPCQCYEPQPPVEVQAQKIQVEQRQRSLTVSDEIFTRQNPQISRCSHDAWWSELRYRARCPHCSTDWGYLLQCPICTTKACPQCQRELRPRFRSCILGVLSKSPVYGYDYHWHE